MPRKAPKVECSREEYAELQKISRQQKTELRLSRRAKIVLCCIEGKRIQAISKELGESENVVIKWRDRFLREGIKGLKDAARSGKPITYDGEFRKRVLETLSLEAPNGQARWDGPTIAEYLNVSVDAVWRLLRQERIQLARQRTWCISTDPEFTAKAADVVGLYLNPPENAVVISVDEKPSMQALSRTTGYVKTRNGKIVKGIKSTYRRNGTRNLFAALEVATGVIHGKTTVYKKRVDFLGFMDELLLDLPQGNGVEYHVILDNYCVHKRNNDWLSNHPNVHFHFTPTSASWLNQIEIWFNIMTRKVLKGASFNSTEQLCEAIRKFIAAYNLSAEPFTWRKREVVGSQIKNTITNLRN
jgi:transposase